MSCPVCEEYRKEYGFVLETDAYFMTMVPEVKTCCPVKVYVTYFDSTSVKFTCNGKEYEKPTKQFYRESWKVYEAY